MAIRVSWKDTNKSCILTRFYDPWTLQDFLEARKAWYRMIKSVTYRVPILLDFRESVNPPNGILRQFSAIHRTPHPRQGHIFILGINSTYGRLGDHLLAGVVDEAKSVRFVESEAEISI